MTDVFNSILVRGDVIGDVCFYGRGAGKLPTASAVVADVIDCAKHSDRTKIFGWNDAKENYVTDHLDDSCALYVRAQGDEKAILDLFPAAEIASSGGEFAFITDAASERELLAKLSRIPGVTVKSTIKVTDY